jgi:two-component SAPR family response regulator
VGREILPTFTKKSMNLTISFTKDELYTIINALEMNEFHSPEDHSEDYKKHLSKLCLKLIKKYHSTGYTTEGIDMLKNFLTVDYPKTKPFSELI